MSLRIETFEIACTGCNEITFALAPGLDVDVVTFLKGAVYRGWRLIDADCAQVTSYADGGADVVLRGLCKRCATVIGGIRIRSPRNASAS